MAYNKTVWTNREVEKPRTYTMTDNGDGTITLTPAEGQIFSAGTPIDATNMNNLENQVEAHDVAIIDVQTELGNKLNLTGGTLTGDLHSQGIMGADELHEAGTALFNKYAYKSSAVTWATDTNGVRVNMGKYAGTGKPVILYLTSAQPAASSTEHRVWIQIDNF